MSSAEFLFDADRRAADGKSPDGPLRSTKQLVNQPSAHVETRESKLVSQIRGRSREMNPLAVYRKTKRHEWLVNTGDEHEPIQNILGRLVAMNETKDGQHVERVKTDTQQRDSPDEFPVHDGSAIVRPCLNDSRSTHLLPEHIHHKCKRAGASTATDSEDNRHHRSGKASSAPLHTKLWEACNLPSLGLRQTSSRCGEPHKRRMDLVHRERNSSR